MIKVNKKFFTNLIILYYLLKYNSYQKENIKNYKEKCILYLELVNNTTLKDQLKDNKKLLHNVEKILKDNYYI